MTKKLLALDFASQVFNVWIEFQCNWYNANGYSQFSIQHYFDIHFKDIIYAISHKYEIIFDTKFDYTM